MAWAIRKHKKEAALLAHGINEGMNSFAKNFFDMRQQDTGISTQY